MIKQACAWVLIVIQFFVNCALLFVSAVQFTPPPCLSDAVDEAMAKRFLMARQWDMPKATQLLHDCVVWRKSFGSPVDPKSCLTELVKGKTFIHGTDRVGNAVLYHWVRKQDPSERDLDEAVRAAVFWAEQAEKQGSTGKLTLVFVRAGATTANGDLNLARSIAPILQNNFPERLDKVLVRRGSLCVRATF
jgi:hypothetical protein